MDTTTHTTTQTHEAARYAAILAALTARHPGVAALGQGEALCEAPGTPPTDPIRAAVQRVQAGTYPWPRRRIGAGGSWYVLLADIAMVLAGIDVDSAPRSTTELRPAGHRPGRPRKNAAPRAAGGAA